MPKHMLTVTYWPAAVSVGTQSFTVILFSGASPKDTSSNIFQ